MNLSQLQAAQLNAIVEKTVAKISQYVGYYPGLRGSTSQILRDLVASAITDSLHVLDEPAKENIAA